MMFRGPLATRERRNCRSVCFPEPWPQCSASFSPQPQHNHRHPQTYRKEVWAQAGVTAPGHMTSRSLNHLRSDLSLEASLSLFSNFPISVPLRMLSLHITCPCYQLILPTLRLTQRKLLLGDPPLLPHCLRSSWSL